MDKDCLECGSNDGTHYPRCSNEGGGAFGRKLDLSSVGADGYHPPQPEPKTVLLAENLRVFHLSGELNAVSREATEHAEARAALVDEVAALKRDAHAVRVLDAWARKHSYRDGQPGERTPAAVCCSYRGAESWTIDVMLRHGIARLRSETAVGCRIAAADALLKEDPSLGSEV